MDAILKDFPLEFVHKPIGFGWAPDRHFRSQVWDGHGALPVVLKRCWSLDAYRVERRAYEIFRAHMPVKIPRLLAGSVIDGQGWLVVEDIGACCADGDSAGHRAGLLRMLGRLHGRGRRLMAGGFGRDAGLPVFDDNGERYAGMRTLIDQARRGDFPGLGQWVLRFFAYLVRETGKQDGTIVHGDTDWSNVIVSGAELGLIDLERCTIGPSFLDFSKIAGFIQNSGEYRIYADAFNRESDHKLTLDQVWDIAYLGEVYDGFHWICYDIENTIRPSYPEYAFQEDAFRAKVNKLFALYRKRFKG